jgi:hypothetical protein
LCILINAGSKKRIPLFLFNSYLKQQYVLNQTQKKLKLLAALFYNSAAESPINALVAITLDNSVRII